MASIDALNPRTTRDPAQVSARWLIAFFPGFDGRKFAGAGTKREALAIAALNGGGNVHDNRKAG